MNRDDFNAILAEVRRFVRTEVVPAEEHIEEFDEIPVGIRKQAAVMGLFGFALPEEFGGLGLTMAEEAELVMELGYTTPAFRSMFGTNNGIAGHTILEAGTSAQQSEYLPRLASGELTASFALTEPGAGSDPSTLSTTAQRLGDGWVIDGVKRYITNAPNADVFMVYARTDANAPGTKGISVFIVDRAAPGLTVGPKDHKMGQAGAWTADVTLDSVEELREPASALQ